MHDHAGEEQKGVTEDMAGSINVYISRQKNPKLFRWCDLAMSEGYEKWQLSSYFRDRMEDILDSSMREEGVHEMEIGAVCVREKGSGVTRGPGIQLYLFPEDGLNCPCVRAYIDYMRQKRSHVSQELCYLLEGDIRTCNDASEEYVVGYNDLKRQRLRGFCNWSDGSVKELTQPRENNTIKERMRLEKREPSPMKTMVGDESMGEMKEDDLFGFF